MRWLLEWNVGWWTSHHCWKGQALTATHTHSWPLLRSSQAW
jgi:hypothetical protein